MNPMFKKIFSVSLFALAILSDASAYSQATGGSDYAWYQVSNCTREPYGVIANYNTNSSIINSQLSTMFANGQRRLRIPIFFGHGLNTGTVMDSTGGNLSLQNRQNLTNFLAAVKNAGFAEVEIAFFPIGPMNDPNAWPSYNENYYQENWNVIYNLHSIIASSGLLYRIDLHNEGAPTTSQTVLLQYDQHLWNNYVFIFGKNDTVGFSIIPEQNRLQNIQNIYGDSQYGNHGAPYLFDLHIYDETTNTFITAYNILHTNYPALGWIIGEAYYNDALEAASLKQAATQTGQTIFYVTQWPILNPSPCASSSTPGIDVVPLSYNNYLSQGW